MSILYKRFLFISCFILVSTLGLCQNRMSLKDDIEKSSTVGSIPITDSNNEQSYFVPGAETAILTISAGVPTWVVGGSGEMTTVTDLVNGLNINLTGFDITIAPDIPELSNVGSLDPLNDYVVIYDNSSASHRKASVSQFIASTLLSDISDVPAYPTATTDNYILNYNDATNTFTWTVQTTIYTANSSLTGNRDVDLATFGLSFTDGLTTLQGTGATSATDALLVENSGATDMLKIQNNGELRFGNSGTTEPSIYPFNTVVSETPNLAGLGLTFFSQHTNEVASTHFSFQGSTLTPTSGSHAQVQFKRTFAPTSGTASFNNVRIITEVNQTGGTSDPVRALWVTATLTSAPDYRAIEATSGAIALSIQTATSTSHTASNYRTVLVDDDTAGGVVTVNLPAVSGRNGIIYIIKKLGTTGNVIIDGNASETIDGATTQTITVQWGYIKIQCNGTAWFITGQN